MKSIDEIDWAHRFEENIDIIVITAFVILDWSLTVTILDYTTIVDFYTPRTDMVSPQIDIQTAKNLMVLKSVFLYMGAIEIAKRIKEL